MATIKFWSEMTKATTVDGEDKVMIGRNATGEAMYADFQYLINQAGMNSSDYIPVDGNTLPDGGEGNKVTFASPGTYTQSGGDDVVVPENSLGIIVWDGDEWSLSSTVDFDFDFPDWEDTDTVIEESGKITSESAVLNYTVPKYSKRVLPIGYKFTDIDRPDAPEISIPEIIDSEGHTLTDNNSGFRLLKDFDRPDLNGVVVIDAEHNIVKKDTFTGSGGQPATEKSMTDLFYYPQNIEAYNLCADEWGSYTELIDLWDVFLREQDYVSKSKIGESSETGRSIYRYDFKPETPIKKVLLFAGTHASEAHTVVNLLRFFEDLMYNFPNNEGLKWARQNVHFVVCPMVSPDSWDIYGVRRRRVWETAPFEASWVKTGNECVIEFDQSDFPNNNPNVSASDYFSNEGIENNTYLTIIDSGSADLPDYSYLITESINGQSVRVSTPDNSNNGSGTCLIYVSTDPNRNMQVQGAWEGYKSSSNIVKINEEVPTSFDNKGTKPFSLGEMVAVKNLIDVNGNTDYILDMHTGAGQYNFRYDGQESKNFIDEMNSFFELYTDNIDTAPSSGLDKPGTIATYGIYEKGFNAFTAEWDAGCNMIEERVLEMQRWIGNLIIQGSNFLKQ